MTVGERLAAARVAQGRTVQDVSGTTFVRAAVVEAIERDDFAPSGGPAYARGHIRLLAKDLGLDERDLLREFAAQIDDHHVGPIAAALVRHNAAEIELTRPTGVRWGRLIGLTVLLGGVAAAAAYAAYLLVHR